MAVHGNNGRRYPTFVFGDTMSVALQTFRIGKWRFILTSLGMVIGTASLILVVTIGLTGKQYLLQQIQNIGSNMMVAEYSGGGIYGRDATSDFLTLDDLNAVRQQVPGISNASPLIQFHDHVAVPGGKEREVIALGVSPQYLNVRNLQVLTGRFFDDADTQARNKVAVITQKLAVLLYGSQDAADRPGDQAQRTSVHRDRHISRARRYLRTDRSFRRHYPDPLHRGPLLHQQR